jgi:hypothetical protein
LLRENPKLGFIEAQDESLSLPLEGGGPGWGWRNFFSAVAAHFHHPPPNPLPSQGGGFLMIDSLILFDRIYT